ncbi:MAG: GatB/YqeY domain-containing protein [Thermodesulfobacteriota bacterium]
MGLSDLLRKEMLAATKNRDKERLSVLRMIRSALHNREIEKRAELTDEEVLQVLGSMVKKAKESIEQFQRGHRQDLVDKEQRELEVILSFMPRQMSHEEIREEIAAVIRELQVEGPKSLGLVMKASMERLKGKADGRLVNQIAKELLSSG